jgi:hypothetical protein
MSEDRQPPSTLKGRLADVYVPALVGGSVEALSRRLGNRATLDDPLFGRASSLASIDPLLSKTSDLFRVANMTYRHVASTTGVDRDTSEGALVSEVNGTTREMPILVVAERRRLREIELRIYYTPDQAPPSHKPRGPLVNAEPPALPQLASHVIEALRKGAVERVLSAFEETSRIVDPHGKWHPKRDGEMSAFVSDFGAVLDIVPGGAADDGRTCCVEATRKRSGREGTPMALSFERGDSGLLRELRLYYEP